MFSNKIDENKNPIQIDSRTIVPAIISFDTKGNIVPLYIRVGTESYRIVTSYRTYPESELFFRCQIEVDDRLVETTLIYHKSEHVWSIPQIKE